MKRWTKGLCALTVAVGVLGPAALSSAQDATDKAAVVDVPAAKCTGGFTATFENWASDSGERTAQAALDDYFQETTAAWTSAPTVATGMRTATADAVARGGWVRTEPPADEALTFANLVADGEVVARFYVQQLPDESWRVEGFDYCPSEATAAGLVLRDGE